MNDPFARLSHMIESAKDLTVEAAASAAARLAETPPQSKPKEIIKLLDSSFEREVLNGLKVVVSYMSTGKDASRFFPYVIKNINSSNLKIRKLIYIYLARYSDANPDLILLAINSIQKSLNDKDPQIRSLGLRIISSINNPAIISISMLAVGNSINDLSPIVRRSCAISISKIFSMMGTSLDQSNKNLLINKYLHKLLHDSSLLVLNSAIVTYYNICPSNFKLIHDLYRHYCSLLSEFDEWTQIVLINVLTNYSRLFLPRPKIINLASNEFVYLPDNEFEIILYPVYDVEFHPDLEMFLNSMKNSIFSNNEALILSITKAFFFLAPSKTFKDFHINNILIRRLNSNLSENIKIFRLQTILYIILKKDSLLFQNSYKSFFLLPNDSLQVGKLKLNILSLIINENNIKSIVNELRYYALNITNDKLAVEAIKTIGKCSQINIHWNKKVLSWLLKQVQTVTAYNSSNTRIINECLAVIRYLVQQSPENNIKSVIRLSDIITTNKIELNAHAKSSIIWLVGEFINIIPKFIPDFVRVLVKSFKYQDQVVRYNILLLVCKYYTYDLVQYQTKHADDPAALDAYPKTPGNFVYAIFNHTVNLAKYDNSYDIRDQARMLYLLLNSDRIEMANLILQAPKPVPLILITNQPILNNLASPKLDDDFYPEDSETGSKIRRIITNYSYHKDSVAQDENVEISPQPSNKNSFSEKRLNSGLSVPKCVINEIKDQSGASGSTDDTSNFQNLLIPSLVAFMNVPSWSEMSKLPPDSIRNAKITPGFQNNVKSISSSSFIGSEKKQQYENANHAVSYGRFGKPGTTVKNFNLKNNYKVQSLDEFLSTQDDKLEILTKNKKYLKQQGPKRTVKQAVQQETSEELSESEEEESESEAESQSEEDSDQYEEESEDDDEKAKFLK